MRQNLFLVLHVQKDNKAIYQSLSIVLVVAQSASWNPVQRQTDVNVSFFFNAGNSFNCAVILRPPSFYCRSKKFTLRLAFVCSFVFTYFDICNRNTNLDWNSYGQYGNRRFY